MLPIAKESPAGEATPCNKESGKTSQSDCVHPRQVGILAPDFIAVSKYCASEWPERDERQKKQNEQFPSSK